MDIIYTPKGKAREYAALALNLYGGCVYGCRYCYAAGFPWSHDYHDNPHPKKNVIERIRADARRLSGRPDTPEILISFIGDPYQPIESDLSLTRRAIEILIEYNLPFTILSKGGQRACRDFDLLATHPRARFGTSLSFWHQSHADAWEPNAAPIIERVNAIYQAHGRGIPTWVSLEPVIDPHQALAVIANLHPFVDHWKIGKINHRPDIEAEVDWPKFTRKAVDLLEGLGADYYLKRSLTDLIPRDGHCPLDGTLPEQKEDAP